MTLITLGAKASAGEGNDYEKQHHFNPSFFILSRNSS